MWIDTHCHLDAQELKENRHGMLQQAFENGVLAIVIPAICRDNFGTVKSIAHQYERTYYAVGIHPVYIKEAKESDLEDLRRFLEKNQNDSKLVAIGEIGLDFYISELKEGPLREKQEYFYEKQLKLAQDFQLPVLLHSRRSVDIILKYLRKIKVKGIAHAFNGSFQQAQSFLDLGFKLSFCGTATHDRAIHLQKLVKELPPSAIVIETDAPDLLPAWLDLRPNTPLELPKIGAFLANLKKMPMDAFSTLTKENTLSVLTKLKRNL